MAFSPNGSGQACPDSLNHIPTTGQQNLLPCPSQDRRQAIQPSSFNPVVPVVPQPMGAINATPLNQFPFLAFPNGLPMGFPSTVPGLLPGGHLLQSREYNVLNNSHPVHGERQINHIPQGENYNANSHNSSSGWSSGFTNVLQDLSLDHSVVRPSSPHIESRTQVSHS